MREKKGIDPSLHEDELELPANHDATKGLSRELAFGSLSKIDNVHRAEKKEGSIGSESLRANVPGLDMSN